MTSLFKEPTNALERLVLNNAMWETKVYFSPTYFKKHTAAEVHMHRRTAQFQPEVESPLFNNNVVDEEDTEE